jgi:hypothetical protein
MRPLLLSVPSLAPWTFLCAAFMAPGCVKTEKCPHVEPPTCEDGVALITMATDDGCEVAQCEEPSLPAQTEAESCDTEDCAANLCPDYSAASCLPGQQMVTTPDEAGCDVPRCVDEMCPSQHDARYEAVTESECKALSFPCMKGETRFTFATTMCGCGCLVGVRATY